MAFINISDLYKYIIVDRFVFFNKKAEGLQLDMFN